MTLPHLSLWRHEQISSVWCFSFNYDRVISILNFPVNDLCHDSIGNKLFGFVFSRSDDPIVTGVCGMRSADQEHRLVSQPIASGSFLESGPGCNHQRKVKGKKVKLLCWVHIQAQSSALQTLTSTVYPNKYAHGFVVLCFVVVTQSFIMNSHEVFNHIHQGCFAGTGSIVRLPQCPWSKPDGYGKISQCITTTKHSKAKTVCIFLGIYCTFPDHWAPTIHISIWISISTPPGVYSRLHATWRHGLQICPHRYPFAPGSTEAMHREVHCSGAQRADAPAGYWTKDLTWILISSPGICRLTNSPYLWIYGWWFKYKDFGVSM